MKKILLTIGLILTLTLSGITPLLSVNTAYAETDEERAERVRRSSLRPGELFAEDCYGYPYGDTHDASDFALKVDCILDTGDQNQEHFNEDGTGYSAAENFILKVINYMITIIGSIALLLIVVAGIMMITSPGNENQRSKATEILTASIIGLVLAFSSFIIVNFIQGLFF